MSKVIGGTWAFAAFALAYLFMDAVRGASPIIKAFTLAGVVITIIVVALIVISADPEK